MMSKMKKILKYIFYTIPLIVGTALFFFLKRYIRPVFKEKKEIINENKNIKTKYSNKRMYYDEERNDCNNEYSDLISGKKYRSSKK